MRPILPAVSAAVTLVACAGYASAQDLYDTTVLRTLNFQFHDANWEALLRSNYASQTNILADLTVDGVTYPNIGVRIRGNTSYTALPSNSQKFSLNVEMDFVDPNQDLMGYDALNLNNGFHDPTFCREVLYNNYVAQFIPNPRANHVVVTINGQNWGVYINVQQFDKTMLSNWFADTDGLRIKCANNPNGPGLRYVGASSGLYTSGYEIKNTGGLTDPWAAHIQVCNAVTNGAAATWQTTIDPIFAVDPSIWSVVFENMLTDDDSYVNKGADFMTYRNPTDSRTYLLQTDANETFTQNTWSPILNFTSTTKPFLNHVLANAELRQRYMAHYRTAKTDLTWTYFEPKATALRTLIDAAVQADPKKLYTYAQFQSNFTTSVTLAGSGPVGGTVPGLSAFCTGRAASLNSNVELNAQGPIINSVTPSDATPDPFDSVSISASVSPSTSNVSKVELFYRPSPSGTYQRVQMTNNGSGVYTAPLPVAATPGQRVPYYVAATSANTYSSLSFLPKHTEWDPMSVNYTFGASGGMRITEFMYSGGNGEFVEFTNISSSPVDMTGWSLDDDHAIAGTFSLTPFGVVQPGESVIVTDNNAETFRAAWGLTSTVKIIGGLGAGSIGNNYARNDEINLYNASNILVDRLAFGDQTYPGTIRTQNFSGQTCAEHIGQDDIASWVKSAVADRYASHTSTGGDVANPGAYAAPSCSPCVPASVTTQPQPSTVCVGEPVDFSVIAAGTGPFEYRWAIEIGEGIYLMLSDGPYPGVGTIAGAHLPTLTITDLVPGTAERFYCRVTNACGDIASDLAALTVREENDSVCTGCPTCAADFDANGGIDGADLAAFFTDYEAGAECADVDQNGGIDGGDIAAFFTAYEAGGC